MLEAAVPLLAKQGLTGNLVAEAAKLAGCTQERARPFFGRDEDLVFAWYARFAADLEATVADLPTSGVGARFQAAMVTKLSLVEPYWEAFAALLAVALDPDTGWACSPMRPRSSGTG